MNENKLNKYERCAVMSYMSRWMMFSVQVWFVLLLASCFASAEDRHSLTVPEQFVVARHTFFDFGPPNDYYEVFVVARKRGATFVEKMTLTPWASCTQPAKYEFHSATTEEPVAELLGGNPCTIPEKELRKELKRKKHQLVFSGANVTLQVQCGEQTRLIRADILDRDMFDSNPNTPRQTSWTMRLLQRLDGMSGPNVMDKPVFGDDTKTQNASNAPPELVQHLAAGQFNSLFKDAPDKPSEIFRQSQIAIPRPTVTLVRIAPISPQVHAELAYPPLARFANVNGTVVFKARLNVDGSVQTVDIVGGHPMLIGATKDGIEAWRFPAGEADRETEGVLEFKTNCIAK